MMRMIAVVLIACVGLVANAGPVLYVSPAGNDAWSGRFSEPLEDGSDGPLATPHGARDRARDIGRRDPVTILFRGGEYFMDEALTLTPLDGGRREAPVTYAAVRGETPIFSVGSRITDWNEGDDGRWTAHLPQVEAGEWRFSSLWVDGEFRRPARYPNEGFVHTAGTAAGHRDDEGKFTDAAYTAFKFKPGDIRADWHNRDDVVIVAMHSWDTTHFHPVEVDEETNTVVLNGRTVWEYERWGEKQRYYIEHCLEALDAPGEWYLDRVSGDLHYLPKPGESPENTVVIAPAAKHVLHLEGDAANGSFVEHVHFRGISFRHADHSLDPGGLTNQQAAWSVHGAVQASGARFVTLTDCEVTQSGTYGIWFREDCEAVRIERCRVHHLGAGGVRIGTMGDDATSWGWHNPGGGQAPRQHGEGPTRGITVHNCKIYDGGLVYPAGVGVWVGRSSYNTISNNHIHDFYYTGISIGWSWGYAPSSAHNNVIEYNLVHDLGKDILSDMGGIYLLGKAPGTIVRHNIFHSVDSYYYGGWGIYPDEGSTDLLIENNIAYDCKTGGFHQHYGRENTVRNNIFAFSPNAQIMRTREEEHISFHFRRNIVYFDNGNLLGSNWTNDQFDMNHNLYWDAAGNDFTFAGASFEEWQARGHDTDSIIADPLFRDPSARDFALSPDSPAITELGFRPIDTSNIGTYGSPDWAGPRE